MSDFSVFCDGGARGNPGPAAAAFLVYDAAGKVREKCGKYLGEATNNEAEYEGVIAALNWFAQNFEKGNLAGKTIEVRLDSELVVCQLKGIYRVKVKNLQVKMVELRRLEESLLAKVTYVHIPREKNRLADRVVNEVLDGVLGR